MSGLFARNRLVGDAVRVAGVLSFLGAAVAGRGVAMSLFALVLLCLTLLRLLVRPGLDAATGLMLVAGAWASLLDLYVRWSWLDLPVHFAANGLGAVALYEALVRAAVLAAPEAPYPRRARLGAVVITLSLGLTLGVLWELGEWYGQAHVDSRIQVGYDDTLGDLAAGGAGALFAAWLNWFVTRRRRGTASVHPPEERRSGSQTDSAHG